ncbi:O-methyltransferase [Bdellovibrio reynosensis]|uniref:Class I SAM-dependent methyltransferase n=1 Tax=Bdellovibrio reynosensis TaxID=2835041 RepID=A0ABY4CCA6_9BACT|nr:class I SAM-dependent methyltransferase [Bdellovibrio reynosensis]UOF01517.1 class I SAM-dependent methyltransferase [Bdellovibrio reynosensis]
MSSTLASEKVQTVLANLYKDATENHEVARREAMALPATASRDEFYTAMGKAYMCIGSEFGNLLYAMARSMKAKTVVEFGTSFGVSTIYLACAMRDNGGGKVITTEFLPAKVEKAKMNLGEAGLLDYVEFRGGDALKTLKEDIPELDMVFLDGPKDMYLDVLKLLEPKIKSSGIVAADNTNHKGLENFLEHVRSFANGYVSSPIVTQKNGNNSGHEVSIKI